MPVSKRDIVHPRPFDPGSLDRTIRILRDPTWDNHRAMRQGHIPARVIVAMDAFQGAGGFVPGNGPSMNAHTQIVEMHQLGLILGQ